MEKALTFAGAVFPSHPDSAPVARTLVPPPPLPTRWRIRLGAAGQLILADATAYACVVFLPESPAGHNRGRLLKQALLAMGGRKHKPAAVTTYPHLYNYNLFISIKGDATLKFQSPLQEGWVIAHVSLEFVDRSGRHQFDHVQKGRRVTEAPQPSKRL